MVLGKTFQGYYHALYSKGMNIPHENTWNTTLNINLNQIEISIEINSVLTGSVGPSYEEHVLMNEVIALLSITETPLNRNQIKFIRTSIKSRYELNRYWYHLYYET